MGLRFRKSFKMFPGVRLNLSGGGVSATFGIPGASVNVGPRGVRSTVGIPGSGLSYTTDHTRRSNERTSRRPSPSPAYDTPQYAPSPSYDPPPTYWQAAPMRDINSASVENLTSHSLVELRDLISQARSQRSEIADDLSEAEGALRRDADDLGRRQRSWFRYFYKRRIAELEIAVGEAEGEIARLTEWQQTTHVDISFETGVAAQKAYGSLVRAFDALRTCAKIWDITSDRIANRVVERSYAARTLTRTVVRLDFADSDLVRFAGRAMQFQNINGEDILIYPGVVLMPRADGAFALIDLREIELDYSPMQFVEDEAVPPDSQVVGQTWAKVNKDGRPDLRFRDNRQIPLCLYGKMLITSPGGVEEEYQFSNSNAAAEFARAFHSYQSALAAN